MWNSWAGRPPGIPGKATSQICQKQKPKAGSIFRVARKESAETLSFRVDKAWRQRCSQRFRNILDMIAKKAPASRRNVERTETAQTLAPPAAVRQTTACCACSRSPSSTSSRNWSSSKMQTSSWTLVSLCQERVKHERELWKEVVERRQQQPLQLALSMKEPRSRKLLQEILQPVQAKHDVFSSCMMARAVAQILGPILHIRQMEAKLLALLAEARNAQQGGAPENCCHLFASPGAWFQRTAEATTLKPSRNASELLQLPRQVGGGAKPCQNHGGSQKKQSFDAKTLEGTRKTKKHRVLEHWVVWQLKTPKLCFFCFLDPPALWHQSFGLFWTPQGFGSILE